VALHGNVMCSAAQVLPVALGESSAQASYIRHQHDTS